MLLQGSASLSSSDPAQKGGTIVTLIKARSWRVMRLALKLGLIVSLLLTSVAVLAPVALAQSATWRGEYYNNVNLSGSPVLIRDDGNIDFNWGGGSPGGGVNSDYFSVRWTAFVSFSAGDYTFSVTVDDGVRLWVDEQLLIDQWRDQGTTTYSAVKSLGSGYHSMRLEYYENYGNALIRLSWQTGGTTGGDWRAEYYNNTWLGGGPVVVRNEAAISYNWGYGSPAAGVNADGFSARWTRDAYFSSSGNYTFSVTVDDGVRLWVDGVNLIDKWFPQSATTYSGYIYLAAGTHQIRVEYFEDTGVATCTVSWSAGGTSGVEVIVDDRDSGFIRGGPSSAWYGRSYGYRGHLFWTWNSRTQLKNWGKWFPYVPTAGNWEVYVYIASKYFGTTAATYSIYHGGTRNSCVVNQSIYYNQWVSLGTYYFYGGSSEYVYLGDVTGESYATRYVGFDAVKFVRRDGVVPPGPTPVPPSGCSITPVLGFGRIWNNYSSVKSKLGCPTEVEKGIWAAEESFQNGYMFWREDTKVIYVLYNNGTWQSFNDTWTSGEPETDTTIVPPPGYYQPKRGFGKVWRENSAVRSGLGWATTEERGFYASVQQFNGGLMFWSNVRGIFVLYSDARWERYD